MSNTRVLEEKKKGKNKVCLLTSRVLYPHHPRRLGRGLSVGEVLLGLALGSGGVEEPVAERCAVGHAGLLVEICLEALEGPRKRRTTGRWARHRPFILGQTPGLEAHDHHTLQTSAADKVAAATAATPSATAAYSATAAANRSGLGDLFEADDARQEDFRLLHDEVTDFLQNNEL